MAALALVVVLLGYNLASVSRASGSTSASAASGLGTVRDVDVDQVKRLIQEGRLSDHEARHYRKLDQAAPSASALR